MKLNISLLTIAIVVLLDNHVEAAVQNCPGTNEVPTMLDRSQGNLVQLGISEANHLCTLVQMSSDSDIKPIGRSYNKFEWENYGGDLSSSFVTFSCVSDSCSVDLPEPEEGIEYYLTSFEYSLDGFPNDAAARFLEKTTFGPTKSDIALFQSFATNTDYVEDQFSKDATSHRAYWRSKVGDWHTYSSTATTLYSNPCDEGARYRKYAFIREDYERYVKMETVGGMVAVSVGSLEGGFLLRTMVANVTVSQSNIIPDGTWQICFRPGQTLGSRIRLKTVTFDSNGELQLDGDGNPKLGCASHIWFGGIYGNPVVHFDTTPPDAITINSDKYTPVLAQVFGGDEILQLTDDLSVCVREDFTHYGIGSESVVIGVTADVNSNSSSYWIYTGTHDYKSNDLDSPLADGGKQAVVLTSNATDQQRFGTLCANTGRTFLNEESCIVSDDACKYPGSNNPLVGPYVVCGSPFEVANDHSVESSILNAGGFDTATRYGRKARDSSMQDQRQTTWMEIALHSEDQLRQRVAWALSQILVVSPGSLNKGVEYLSEMMLNYYDIFVRHAFGNYLDILKEVTYSPVMGEMLTYLDAKSTGYYWGRNGVIQYADENYAREIMQLFTIGLYKLNQDGTRMVNSDGNFIRAYTNDHITEYARVYTGFRRKVIRGNIETANKKGQRNNYIDPMDIAMDWKDNFPKLGLEKQYIGDGYPLCSDLPAGHYLKAGATYRFLGGADKPELLTDRFEEKWGSPKRFQLFNDPSSELSATLCNDPDSTGICDYKAMLRLESDLACSGVECNIDDPRVVEVRPGVFYEYVRAPCVQRAFYSDPKIIMSRDRSATSLNYGKYMCGDPTLQYAEAICCSSGAKGETRTGVTNFSHERVTFEQAVERCAMRTDSNSKQLCTDPRVGQWDCMTPANGGCDRFWSYYWTSLPCKLQAKINYEGGVAIVHDPLKDVRNQEKEMVKNDTPMFFRVDWISDEEDVDRFLTNYETSCASMGCEVSVDGFCLCDVGVQETMAFDSTALESATVEQVLSTATIGGVIPEDQLDFDMIGAIKYYPSGEVTSDTVFEVTDANGIIRYRKNVKSTVSFGSVNNSLTFRNPVHFMSISTPDQRDAEYETRAALEQYFYHPNTAPFLATRYAQRFGISNPSPRYIETISNAFRIGEYTHEGKTFGSGNYGDMKAMVAAVILDRESDSPILDADPVHGSLLEPFMKIVRMMRSLEYQGTDYDPLVRLGRDLQNFIGQEAHKLPNVFSFFRPEYKPPGRIGVVGLTSPESMVLDGPKSINLMNAVISHIKYGLNDCYWGLGLSPGGCSIGNSQGSMGHNSYEPGAPASTADIVDALATLLTSGRLSAEARKLVITAYDQAARIKDPYHGLVSAQQLITASPEFHANGLVHRTGNARQISPGADKKGGDYKAVIQVMLGGGCDSMNMLVPADECQSFNGTTTHDMYNQMRGVLAFNWAGGEGDLQIDVSASELPQTCNKFALHQELPFLQELYNQGDLAFVANAGVKNSNGMDKRNYRKKSVTQLFAHNSMQDEGQAVDPFEQVPGTGVLGRAKDVLTKQGYSVNSISINSHSVSTEGLPGVSKASSVVSSNGVNSFAPRPGNEFQTSTTPEWFDIEGLAAEINGETNTNLTGIFGDTWSDVFVGGVEESRMLHDALNAVELDASPGYTSEEKNRLNQEDGIENDHWKKWSTLFKLIETRDERKVDRDVFFMGFGGWDHHTGMKANLQSRFHGLNHGLQLMVEQLKQRGLWDQVTIVITSDFGRTMTPNGSQGSDHAWGGNYFILGGNVKGGRIHGQYPYDLTPETGPLVADKRGRFIPTTSWDSIWNGVIEWLGVSDPADLDYCLPNKDQTAEGDFRIFSRDDLFDAEEPSETAPDRRGLRGT